MDILKKCTGCKEEQPVTNFYKNKLNHDGRSNYCVNCTKVNSKKYFQKKKEKSLQIETENMMKMVLLSENSSSNADNLMKILMIEKMCKSILEELGGLKKSLSTTELEITK